MGAAAPNTTEITPAGERITLMPHRTAFWHARSTLLLADLHLGKGETLAAGGVPVPKGIVDADLSRLSAAVRLTGATRVLVLGDLLHAAIGIVPAMVDQVARWRRSLDAELCVVPGNHDRKIAAVADAWGLTLYDPIHHDAPFTFVHDPEHAPSDSRFAWSGHIHPRIRLKGQGDSISMACFVVGASSALLPAFSRFTQGTSVLPSATERVWGVAEETLVEIPTTRARTRPSLA